MLLVLPPPTLNLQITYNCLHCLHVYGLLKLSNHNDQIVRLSQLWPLNKLCKYGMVHVVCNFKIFINENEIALEEII